jgi:hypothetical protein
MYNRIFNISIISICMIILISCATNRVAVSVNSLAEPDSFQKNRYVILSNMEGVDSSDLQFKEYSGYIDNILNEKGFTKASSPDDAQIVIFLAYGMGGPDAHQQTYSSPVFGQTGVSSSTTYGTVSSNRGGTATYSGTTNYTPTYGVTGFTEHVKTRITFTKGIILEAIDVSTFKNEKKMVPVWKVYVMSIGSSNDLRLMFPFMAVAMKPYIGINTGKQVIVGIPENDPQVLQLRERSRPVAK